MVTDSDNPRICQTLLLRAGQGDTAAFAELYDRTAPAVFGLIRSILPDVGQAEDTALEVYLHAWRTASRYDPGRDDASTLLMTAARRHAVERIRTAPPRDDASGQPHRAVSAEDVADLVRRPSCAHLLAKVPVASREVLVLVCFRGQTLVEVAELLGIQKDTAVSRLNDALASLRQCRGSHSVDVLPQARETSRPRQRDDAR